MKSNFLQATIKCALEEEIIEQENKIIDPNHLQEQLITNIVYDYKIDILKRTLKEEEWLNLCNQALTNYLRDKVLQDENQALINLEESLETLDKIIDPSIKNVLYDGIIFSLIELTTNITSKKPLSWFVEEENKEKVYPYLDEMNNSVGFTTIKEKTTKEDIIGFFKLLEERYVQDQKQKIKI